MSDVLFPDLGGLTWDYKLTPVGGSTLIQTAVSGREVRAAFWTMPKFKIQLTYNYLHADPSWKPDPSGNSELDQLMGFFLSRQGSFDSFLLDLGQLTRKPQESFADGQNIGTGDGTSTKTYQLTVNRGGFNLPIQNPAGGRAAIQVAGVAKVQGTDYNITNGIIQPLTVFANGGVVLAQFNWYLRCRFEKDELDFNNFMYQLWDSKQVDLITVNV
jgi:uncharacterized protein (TIGR02217 family)